MASIRRWRASATSRRFFSSTSSAVSRKSRSASAMRPISSRPGGRHRCPQIAARDGEHALAHSRQAGEEVAIDIEPDDQNRTQEAKKRRAEDHAGAVTLNGRSFAARLKRCPVRCGHQSINSSRKLARELIVLGHELLALCKDRELVLACFQDAVRALDKLLELVDALPEPRPQPSHRSRKLPPQGPRGSVATERRSAPGRLASARRPP